MTNLVKLEGTIKQYSHAQFKRNFVVSEDLASAIKTKIIDGKMLVSISDKDVAKFAQSIVGGEIRKKAWDGYSYPYEVWVSVTTYTNVKTENFITPKELGRKFQFVMQNLATV